MFVRKPFFFLLLFPVLVTAQDTIGITLNPAITGLTIAPDFAGLSFEMNSVNKGYFSAHKDTLIRLFQTLGLKSLRIGGNSVDKDTLTTTSSATRFTTSGLDSLFGFVQHAGCKTLMGLNFGGDFNPSLASTEVSYILGHYSALMKGFEIGNEADLYHSNGFRPSTYSLANFEAQYLQYRDTILAHNPSAVFTGPTAATNYTSFTLPFCRNLKGKFAMLTQHYYVAAANSASVHKQVVALMSAAKMNSIVSEVYALVQCADSSGIPFRMGECNSFYNGGQWSVSDAYASALWALDYMYALARVGCAGVNFHGALGGPYTVVAYKNKIYSARPIYYGILAFQEGSKGKFISQSVINNHINLNTYSVIDSLGFVYTTIVNKDTLVNAVLKLDAGNSLYTTASYITLSSSSFTDTISTTLGGQSVGAFGTIGAYSWQTLAVTNHAVEVGVPFGSAMIVRFSPSSSGIQTTQKSGLKVYPNPSTGVLYLVNREALPDHALAEVFDLPGKRVYSGYLKDRQNQVDLSPLATGIYMLKVSAEGKMLLEQKIILSR
jgi:hypothetical protein